MTDAKEAAVKRAAALDDKTKLITRSGHEVVGFVTRDDEDDSGDH